MTKRTSATDTTARNTPPKRANNSETPPVNGGENPEVIAPEMTSTRRSLRFEQDDQDDDVEMEVLDPSAVAENQSDETLTEPPVKTKRYKLYMEIDPAVENRRLYVLETFRVTFGRMQKLGLSTA